jgi:hypothetical protein
MKLCDRHFYRGDYVPGVDQVTFSNTQEEFDLCQTCSEELIEFIKQPEKDGTKRTGTSVV